MKKMMEVKKVVSPNKYLLEDAVGRTTTISSNLNLVAGTSVLVVNETIVKVVDGINRDVYWV